MGAISTINIGFVGACGRGGAFKVACDQLPSVRVHAVCDIKETALDEAAEKLGAQEKYSDYDEMLEDSDLDAVVIATPMQLHVQQCIRALERGLHVLSEVPAAVSIEECQRLVETCQSTTPVYMMAEDFNYMKPNVIVSEIIKHGLLGTPYYAEGEYLHELKGLNEATRWRRKWQNGIDGITYGTHSLGPILQCMPEDRVVSVSCAGSGHHYRDPLGEEYAQDTSVMLCKMRSGGLVKIRVDMISDRPHAMTNYQIQGTDGCYESARAPGEKDRIWLRSRCADMNTWLDLDTLEDEFLPDYWRAGSSHASKAGHGGGDYFEVVDFIEAVQGKRSCPIGIHESMDMTLPGLVSQQSVRQGGEWLDVPDSREW